MVATDPRGSELVCVVAGIVARSQQSLMYHIQHGCRHCSSIAAATDVPYTASVMLPHPSELKAIVQKLFSIYVQLNLHV